MRHPSTSFAAEREGMCVSCLKGWLTELFQAFFFKGAVLYKRHKRFACVVECPHCANNTVDGEMWLCSVALAETVLKESRSWSGRE